MNKKLNSEMSAETAADKSGADDNTTSSHSSANTTVGRSLFVKQDLILHSGEKSDFKIECDALTDEDLECLAYLVSKKYSFFRVRGVPTGGERLAAKLEKYESDDAEDFLLVDDVLTTGNSMEHCKKQILGNVNGVVIFARGNCPEWIEPIFKFWSL